MLNVQVLLHDHYLIIYVLIGVILPKFCAIEAASATRLSSENNGESSIRSPGPLLMINHNDQYFNN